MNKPTTAALAAVILLLLPGCSGTTDPAPAEPRGLVQSVPSETTEPLVTETPAPAADDAAFLAEVERRTLTGTILDQFSDAELIAFGHEACKQINEGVPPEDLRLVAGEQPNRFGRWQDTSAVFNSALLELCPTLIEEVP